MSRKSGARCRLQVARERRLSVYPSECGMEQDICDVTLWLKGKFRETSLLLWIGQHYSQRDQEIAEVTVITKPRRPLSLTPAAREAFFALGYVIENTGADTFGYPHCDSHHSRHEAIQAFARIEAALRRWRSA